MMVGFQECGKPTNKTPELYNQTLCDITAISQPTVWMIIGKYEQQGPFTDLPRNLRPKNDEIRTVQDCTWKRVTKV